MEIGKSPVSFRSSVYRQFLEEIEGFGVIGTNYAAGDRFGAWEVLHPRPDEQVQRGSDKAMVLLADFGGVRFLHLSNLGRRGQSLLLERYSQLRADIVCAAVPGNNDEPLSGALLARIAPQVIISFPP